MVVKKQEQRKTMKNTINLIRKILWIFMNLFFFFMKTFFLRSATTLMIVLTDDGGYVSDSAGSDGAQDEMLLF